MVRPIKIGVLVDTSGEARSERHDFPRLLNTYVLETLEVPSSFPGQQESPWELDILYSVSTGTEESRREEVGKLLAQDVDILLTYFSSVYQFAKEMSAQRKTLILGSQNRQASVITQERAQEARWAMEDAMRMGDSLPALPDFKTFQANLFAYNEDRYDFSLAPVQFNDTTAVVNHAREALGCQTISMILDGKNSTQLLYDALLKEEAARQGLCHLPYLDIAERPEVALNYTKELDRLGQLNRPGHCIWISVGRQTGVLALFELWEMRGAQTEFKVIAQEGSKEFLEGFDGYTRSGLRGQATLYQYLAASPKFQAPVEAFFRDYPQRRFEWCPDPSQCSLFTPEELRADAFATVGRHTDLFTWAVLSAYSAQATYGRVLTPTQLRDASLDLISLEGTLCDSTSYRDCFSRLQDGKPVHFEGLTSPMTLGLHGRIDRSYSKMSFRTFPEAAPVSPSGEELVLQKTYLLSELEEQRTKTPPVVSPPCPLP